MVGSHADDHWNATAGGTPDAVLETIDDAAVWIKQRLKAGGGSAKSLPILCLDTDGAICTWTKPEDTDPDMIAAAIDQLDADHDELSLDGGVHSSMGERFPNLPLEVHYESLSDEQTSEGSRRAVVATPDVPARLLIDQLDSMGIRIGRVENIWALIAAAWDPGAPHRSTSSRARDAQRVISTDDPVCGCIVLDPNRSRLIWTWSKCGQLIAAGSMRVGQTSQGHTLHQSDLSRLCADWIGWASQLGVAPMRVVLVMPDTDEGLDQSQIASQFASHWPMATTDLITDPDPILATLRATLMISENGQDIPAGKNASGSELTNRPGRSHRSMYRWAGVALVLAGAAVGWTGITLYGQGSETRRQAKSIRSQMVQQIMKLQPPISDLRLPTAELQARLNLLVARTGPMQVTPTKPILEELDTISFVLGMSGIEIDTIQITHTVVKLKIRTADLALAEQINEALRAIDGSHLQWRATPELNNRGNQIEATFTAVWNNGSTS